MSNSFSGTLMVLPGVVIALWLLGRWVRQRGGSVLAPRILASEVAILTLLLLLIRSRSALGLVVRPNLVDYLIAAGLVLLLAHHVVALVGSLASVLGDRLPVRPPWPFFALPLVVYVAILPWATEHREPDGDEPYYLLITHSLAYDFDTELSNNYGAKHSLEFMSRELEPEWADPRPQDGKIYSRHNLVLPLILTPGYRIAGMWGAFLTMTVLSALVAWMTMRLAGRLFPDHVGSSIAAWALLSLTPPLLLYSYQIWTELPAALLVLIALDQVYALRSEPGASRSHWWKLALTLALLPLLKLRFLLLAAPLALLAIWRIGPRRKGVVAVVLVLLAVVAAMLTYNFVAFDQALKDHSLSTLTQIQEKSPEEYLKGGFGLLFDCAFGLFASNPLWILLLPALALMIVRRPPLALDAAVCVVPYLLVVTPRLEWYGAWAPPFRFGIVLLPLMALTLIPLFATGWRNLNRPVIMGLGATALSLALVWLVLPPWTYNLANGTSHIIDHLSTSLGSDTGRFFASYVRVRAASWLIPFVVISALIDLWLINHWLPGRRPLGCSRAWGSVVALLLAAGLPLGASTLATTIVEFEDVQVSKQGGEVFPEAWVSGRPRFRGGWKLGNGDSLSAPINAGGENVTLSIDLQVRGIRSKGADLSSRISEGTAGEGERSDSAADVAVPGNGLGLEVVIGDWVQQLDGVSERGGWQTATVSVLDWPRGVPLVIRLEPTDERWAESEVVLDRVRFVWN